MRQLASRAKGISAYNRNVSLLLARFSAVPRRADSFRSPPRGNPLSKLLLYLRSYRRTSTFHASKQTSGRISRCHRFLGLFLSRLRPHSRRYSSPPSELSPARRVAKRRVTDFRLTRFLAGPNPPLSPRIASYRDLASIRRFSRPTFPASEAPLVLEKIRAGVDNLAG